MRQSAVLPTTTDWYARVFGFPEGSLDDTRKFVNHEAVCPPPQPDPVSGLMIYRYMRHGCSRPIQAGAFELLSVAELRARVVDALEQIKALPHGKCLDGDITVSNVVSESRALHTLPELTGAVFQAASQFNCLEFASPSMTPENGITCYCDDRTQGPACAIAAAAGTQFRQHGTLMKNGIRGQTRDSQINTLADVEQVIRNRTGQEPPWTVENGYIDADGERLRELNAAILNDPSLREAMIAALRIGVQFDTEVTAAFDPAAPAYTVNQTFNSAVSVGYSRCSAEDWATVSSLVLCGSYEATLLTSVLTNCWRLLKQRPPRPVLLTKLGGGVFQNSTSWIQAAIEHAIQTLRPLKIAIDCRIVHFFEVEEGYDLFVRRLAV
uniref:Uncharacterized protein n=1 Tax=Neobodo designis TaxID=312471 RepID=A0A7S1LFR1_NEODS